ncbi:MAG TPA: hypothetical protein PLD11_07570 [Flexilinea sp.]|jgi:hypothetical protein|nr:hypothetical protein [Flexilinea sp.]
MVEKNTVGVGSKPTLLYNHAHSLIIQGESYRQISRRKEAIKNAKL